MISHKKSMMLPRSSPGLAIGNHTHFWFSAF